MISTSSFIIHGVAMEKEGEKKIHIGIVLYVVFQLKFHHFC
jgi:hypothetical protein